MGVVFVGGWYLQSSLMEEQYHNMEQAGQLKKFNKKTIGLSKQIIDQQSQLQQLSITVEFLISKDGKVRTV